MAVIEEGVGVYSRDVLVEIEDVYPFRRVWDDQKHMQEVSREEMQAVAGRGETGRLARKIDCSEPHPTSSHRLIRRIILFGMA
jgi:hypothetical protein